MSAFSPILYDNNKPVVNICKNEELGDDIIVYKKVNFDGKFDSLNPSIYYNEDGKEITNPEKDSVVYKKLGKSNQDQEVYDNEDFPSNTYYIRNDDKFLLQGGRKPKRLSHLSKKRNMKSRRVRKSRRRYSRRKY
jgi:hypothetical protein